MPTPPPFEGLLHAIATNDIPKICALLRETPALAFLLDDAKRSPLTASAHLGHAEVMEALLSSGACAELADGNGQTALQLAVARQDAACVRALLAGAASEDAFEALQEIADALEVGRADDARARAAARDGTTVDLDALARWRVELWAAIDSDDADAIAALEDHPLAKAVLNAPDASGYAPVTYAAAHGKRAALQAFCNSMHTAVWHSDVAGRTALDLAVANHDAAAVEVVLGGHVYLSAADADRARAAVGLAPRVKPQARAPARAGFDVDALVNAARAAIGALHVEPGTVFRALAIDAGRLALHSDAGPVPTAADAFSHPLVDFEEGFDFDLHEQHTDSDAAARATSAYAVAMTAVLAALAVAPELVALERSSDFLTRVLEHAD